jgi:hypothetical protein
VDEVALDGRAAAGDNGVADAAGGSWIWQSVSDRNRRAQSFYRKLAFEPLGAGPVLDVGSDRLTSTIMARAIWPTYRPA